MQPVRPVSDLRNKFAEISEDVHESGRPVVLTRNGRGDMVVMSIESFEELSFHSEVLAALRDAEREAAVTEERLSPDEVLAEARAAAASSVAAGPDRVSGRGSSCRAPRRDRCGALHVADARQPPGC